MAATQSPLNLDIQHNGQELNMSLSKLQEIVKDREAWRVAVHGVAKSQTQLSSSTTTTRQSLANRRHYYSFKIILFTYLFFAVLGLHCCAGFSLVATSGGYSLVVMHRFLIAVASLVVEHGL